ncbi:MAG: Verru_Chthon cassette protein B [Verrucomicrobia bacterium]|nr:Verru_Chthon cassette protein B [Verrucomicrobiota bacterium]
MFIHSLHKARSRHRPGVDSGFSLVEVVIALGIVATVMVALMALLPLGMDALRESANLTVQSRIAQDLIGDVQQADWDTLTRYENELRYFDGEGTTLETAGSGTRLYSAKIEFPETPITLPGLGQNRYARKIVIKVAFTPPGQEVVDWNSTGKTKKRYKEYPTVVTNLTKRAKTSG